MAAWIFWMFCLQFLPLSVWTFTSYSWVCILTALAYSSMLRVLLQASRHLDINSRKFLVSGSFLVFSTLRMLSMSLQTLVLILDDIFVFSRNYFKLAWIFLVSLSVSLHLCSIYDIFLWQYNLDIPDFIIFTFFFRSYFSVIYSHILEYSDSIFVNLIFRSESTSIFSFDSLCISLISFSILLVSDLACSSRVDISSCSFPTSSSIFFSPSSVARMVCRFYTCFLSYMVYCFNLTVFSSSVIILC